ncbi:MAG: hypothetical protein OXG17_02340 [Chloroflexi bacterium]|nr:hypothetical protein [Chloroflexota bacterium]
MATATLEERVSRLEGGFKHLATKVDVAELRGDLHALESRLMRWIVGAILGSVAAAAAVTGVIVALVGAFKRGRRRTERL